VGTMPTSRRRLDGLTYPPALGETTTTATTAPVSTVLSVFDLALYPLRWPGTVALKRLDLVVEVINHMDGIFCH
jgi:hypothetical protein